MLDRRKINKTIRLEYLNSFNLTVTVEKIPEMVLNLIRNNNTDEYYLQLNDLIDDIKKLGFPIHNKSIAYWSNSMGILINCGFDPLTEYYRIFEEDIDDDNEVC